MEADVSKLLPAYRSHKTVRAAPILTFNANPVGDGVGSQNDQPYVILDLGSERVLVMPVPVSFFARSNPAVGDMYVSYDDGYQSWSPRAAFDTGYTRV